VTTRLSHALTDDERLGVVVTEPGPSYAWSAATRFALLGHVVVVGAPQITTAELAATQLRNQGAAAFGAQLDLDDWASINAFASSAAYLAGPVDVLIITAAPTTAPSCPYTPDAGNHSMGTQHLAALLLDTKPQRPQPDLLVVRFTSDPAQPRPGAGAAALTNTWHHPGRQIVERLQGH
jgi:NAD(P)-dependent dehydrogenase (short-subunit alcohol dehydrogenase family)